MSSEFASAFTQFDHRITIIQCIPTKKKKRNSRSSSIISSDELPKFIVRFAFKSNALHIDAINLTNMYQLILTEDELFEHLSSSNLKDATWNKYCNILSSTFTNPITNITLTKGKGGGYMILNIKYPVTHDIILNGTIELISVDEYCQNENNNDLPSKYKQDMVMGMFESALNNKYNAQILNISNINNNNNNNNNNIEAKDEDLKDEKIALQMKIQQLEQENNRLKTMTQNTNMDIGGMGLTQNLGNTLSLSGGIGNVNTVNQRKRKLRDPTMSLMNPRREKKRKTGFQFAGAKKK